MGAASIQSLEFENMCFEFDGSTTVFENVSLVLPKSRAVWVTSSNSGKGRSTLLRLMAGLLQPTSGHYLINGQNAGEMSFEEFQVFRLRMGYGFDMGGLLNNRTLKENLMLPLLYHKLTDVAAAERRVEDILTRFGLSENAGRRPFAVPGSQRKLTCLLRAFVHQPEIVFLDDPITGLKEADVVHFMDFVKDCFDLHGLRQIFFSSENRSLAAKWDAQELCIDIQNFQLKSGRWL
jgi:ABC-type transporter Mla maintaining outer membrane lipid asymmetry ATPase subunit MlaF